MHAVRRALGRVERLEADLAEAREDFWRAIAEAHEAGVTLAALGRELGVSRQRVAQMVAQAD